MLSTNVLEVLKANKFEVTRETRLLVVDAETARREWKKEVDVAFYGKHTETFEVTVTVLSRDAVHVDFSKNGRFQKQKIYTSSAARTINAIKETVQCAGYEF